MVDQETEMIIKDGMREGLTLIEIQDRLRAESKFVKYLSLAYYLYVYSTEVQYETSRASAPNT